MVTDFTCCQGGFWVQYEDISRSALTSRAGSSDIILASKLAQIMEKLNAKQLRGGRGNLESLESTGEKQEIYIVLDNVLDTYNIGSIFRLADAVSAKKVFLCGGSETPPNHRIKKASINTTEWVEWEYCESTVRAVREIREKVRDVQVVAIEQAKGSVAYDQFDYQLPVCLIVGHESDGVSKEVLELCDGIVELPMFGVNISLNVVVSLGIVLYETIEHVKPA